MALDPSIPLRAGRNALVQRDPIERAAGMMKLQHYRNAMLDSEDKRRQQAEARAAMSQIAQMPADQQGAAIQHFQLGQGDISGFQASQKHAQATQKSQLQLQRDRIDALAQLAGTISDQATYERAKFQAGKMGIDGSQFPAQYNPDWVRDRMMAALSAKERLDRMLELEKFAETKRANRSREAAAHTSARAAMISAGKPPVMVQMPGETVAENEAKKYGGYLIDRLGKVDGRADNARAQQQRLSMLKSIDVQTGKLEPMKAWVSGVAESLGFDANKLNLANATNAQAFEAVGMQLVLDAMAAQKGPQTEGDAQRIQKTVASLTNTEEAKNFIIDSAMAINARTLDEQAFYHQYQAQNGTLRGSDKAWAETVRNLPLLANNPNTGLPVFFHDFKQRVRAANPGASEEQVIELWRNKYGRAN